jgi:choline monooxygenase
MSAVNPLFDIAAAPDAASTLPGRAYTDQGVFDLERSAIHFRSWHYAGSIDELATPGSYLTARVLDQNVVVMRGKDGVIRGFYNVCQHRAHELLSGRGCVNLITCPYHAWSYGTDGRFRAGRGTAGMAQAKSGGFDLKSVRVETLADRFVFFNLDPGAGALATLAAGLDAELATQVPEFANLVADGPPVATEIEANWKVIVDNYLECNHCRMAHPAFADMLDMSSYRLAMHGHWTSQKSRAGKLDNAAYRIEADAPVQQALFWWLWPMTTFNVLPGTPELVVFNFMPLSPTRSRQTVQRFALPGDVREPGRERYQNGLLTDEDIALCESVQRGLASRGYDAGRFVCDPAGGEASEEAVHLFHRLVVRALSTP